MRRLVSLAVALTLCVATGPVWADTTVSVLGVEAVDAPLTMANLLSLALQDRVRHTAGYKLVPAKDLDEIKLVFGCVDEKPACMAKAGEDLSAQKLLWGTLKKQGATSFELTVKYLDVASARFEQTTSETIERADLDPSAASQVAERATRTFIVSKLGQVKVTANVEGATVTLGEREVGTTEPDPILLRDVPVGTHVVRVTKEGHEPWSQEIVVQGGQTTVVNVELARVEKPVVPPPPPPPPRKGTQGWKIAFWTTAAAVAGLTGGMIYSGLQVLDAEKEKKTEIEAFQGSFQKVDANKGKETPLQSDDACDEAANLPGAEKVDSACKDGNRYFIITNVLIALTVAAAATSGYLYYRAYLSKEAAQEEEEIGLVQPPTPRFTLTPRAGPDGAGLGFRLAF